MASKQDSHLSNDRSTGDKAPLPQRHRMAMGAKVNGETNPNGAESGPTDKKVGNASCTY